MAGGVGPGANQVAGLVRAPLAWLQKWLLDGEVTGCEFLPPDGPYLVTANHLSLIDPVLVSIAVGRLVRFLALDELFGQHRSLDIGMRYFGAIPISRERPPLGALRQALAALEQGEVVGIFPEGARARYWGERAFKRGAAWLSLATGAPLIPCAVTGSEATLSVVEPGIRIPSVRLSLHPPLYPDRYCDHEDPLGAMMDDWVSMVGSDISHWVEKG